MQQFDRNDLSGFAIDLGGTKLAAARVENGEIVASDQTASNSKAAVQEQMARARCALEALGWQENMPVALALTGRVSSAGTWSTVNAGTLPEIQQIGLSEILNGAFGGLATVCNDAMAAALAESHFGAGQGVQNFCYITVSTGVGGGIVINGRPITSENGLAGHIGFLTSRHSNVPCGSGRIGTVESIAGGRAIAAAATQRARKSMTAKEVFACAKQNQQWAVDIVDTAAAAIAEMCANLTAVVGVERFALGGSIGLADGFVQLVKAHLAREPELFQAQVKLAAMGNTSALLGALVHQRLEHSQE